VQITGIETRTYRYPLEPPFAAAWDPVPRAAQEATLVLVSTDDGITGLASGGDGLPDRGLLERLLVGRDPFDTEAVQQICETVDFHGGRPWAVEIAVWDLVAKAQGVPLWQALGGSRDRMTAYASSGERVARDERAERCLRLVERGVRAVKIRFGSGDWRDDVATVAVVRDAVGTRLEIMVDANHGWRMPGDLSPRWDVGTAAECAVALADLGVYWLEEPLRTDEPEAYAHLQNRGVRIAAGEMVRGAAEARDLVERGHVDVLQCDVLFVGGIGGCRRLAAVAEDAGAQWSPHTWSNGLGLVANLHAALAFSTAEYVEVPFDPPGWSSERRDWLLQDPLEISADGGIAPPPGPGLGVELDLDSLEHWRVA
jgi:D-galactarolactone cycloisomerase